MALPIGQQFEVPVDGKMIAAEITAIRLPDPAHGIESVLIEARFLGMPDALPALEIHSDEWQYLSVSELEARYADILPRNKITRSKAVTY